eukprot:g29646.t1
MSPRPFPLCLRPRKTISTEELLKAFFPGPAAELFARLPQAIETLKGRLGADELYIAEKVDAFQIVRRLIELSCGQRKPYSEARALLDQQSSVSMEVEPEKLALGLQLLPFAEATYEARMGRWLMGGCPEALDGTVFGSSVGEAAWLAGIELHSSEVTKWNTCRERHQEVLILEGVSKPGSPAHFLCFNHEKKLAILSIRGTKTPADALTESRSLERTEDLAGDIEERNLEDGKKLSAHSGFLTAADSVLARVKPVIRDLLAPLGYSLLVTGHSLGASTASLVTRLLRAEMASSEGISSVSCVAFAPCPCMDAKNASDCAKASEGGDAPMVLSFVCNDDAVPRISMQNLGRLSLLGKGASVEEVLQLALANRRRSSDQHVPGAVVEADSKKEGSLSKWTAWRGRDLNFPEMGYLELAPKGISHHMAPVYREALAVVAAARGVAVDVAPKADEVFEDWLGRYAACADEKALGWNVPGRAPGDDGSLGRFEFVAACEALLSDAPGCASVSDLHELFDILDPRGSSERRSSIRPAAEKLRQCSSSVPMPKAGERQSGHPKGQRAVHWPTEKPLQEAKSQDAGGFFDVVVSLAKSSGAADAWSEWTQYVHKYCRCTG